jgi:hypothetical protein
MNVLSFSPITKQASQLFDSDKNTWIEGHWHITARVSKRSRSSGRGLVRAGLRQSPVNISELAPVKYD